MSLKNKGTRAGFDPRTKLLLLVLVILSASTAPSLRYELGLVSLIALFALLCGRWKLAAGGMAFYGVIYLLSLAAAAMEPSAWQAVFLAFFGLIHKVYPCGMLAGLMVATTKVSEFLSAMNRIHAPKKLVIPFAVMLRYMPAIREDWRFIKDAMYLRDVSPTLGGLLRHPARTVECVYVPLLSAASKAADELSIASVTRGIENPKNRTCLQEIRFGGADLAAFLAFAAYFLAGQLWKGVFL